MANVKRLECSLPAYRTNRKEWREEILACARAAVSRRARQWPVEGPFEVVLLLYFTKGKQHDVDNRLKDVLDGLQGAFYDKGMGKARAADRVIKNDSSVCRVIVEKQELPKKYKNRLRSAPGGRLLIRGYRKRRWPLELREKSQAAQKGARQ